MKNNDKELDSVILEINEIIKETESNRGRSIKVKMAIISFIIGLISSVMLSYSVFMVFKSKNNKEETVKIRVHQLSASLTDAVNLIEEIKTEIK